LCVRASMGDSRADRAEICAGVGEDEGTQHRGDLGSAGDKPKSESRLADSIETAPEPVAWDW